MALGTNFVEQLTKGTNNRMQGTHLVLQNHSCRDKEERYIGHRHADLSSMKMPFTMELQRARAIQAVHGWLFIKKEK